MKVNVNGAEHDAKVLSISAKCDDRFTAYLLGNEDKRLAEYSGYVPQFFPDRHYGDYVMLDIDIETGQILNWKKPTEVQLQELAENSEGSHYDCI